MRGISIMVLKVNRIQLPVSFPDTEIQKFEHRTEWKF